VSQKSSHEAIEWFVLNESGAAEDAELAQRWKQWCAEPGNRTEYVCLLQLAQDVCQLPAPAEVGWKEMLRDLAAGEGESEMSRAG
jgi:ferric-dicitrate binding protein FerR (iron transport regulator)